MTAATEEFPRNWSDVTFAAIYMVQKVGSTMRSRTAPNPTPLFSPEFHTDIAHEIDPDQDITPEAFAKLMNLRATSCEIYSAPPGSRPKFAWNRDNRRERPFRAPELVRENRFSIGFAGRTPTSLA
jgi:hypothetical protein